MEYDGRREKVMSEREQDLTNTLIKVTTGRQVKAYFVQGHGERDSAGSDRPGYASVVDALKRDNYTVDKVVLAQSPAGVPADASVLIIAGPTADYLKPEVDAIRTYLRKGGKALFLLDPPVGESARTAPTLEALLKEWGITLGHDVVIDASGMGQLLGTDASVPVVASYPQHPVTENFDLLTAFPLSQSVTRRGRRGAGHGEHAERHQYERSQLVGIRREVARVGRQGLAGRSRRRSPRARSPSRCRCRWMRRTLPAAAARSSGGQARCGREARGWREAGAEAADAHHGRRRLRLRDERRRGDSGQRGFVRQHEQLADAAGRSHLDPPARRRAIGA